MFDKKHGRPCAVAFAVAMALGLSACGGGGGGGSNVRPTPPSPPPPPVDDGGFTGGKIDVGAGDTLVWPKDIGGSIDLIKVGAGTLVLTGTDSYGGGTTISEGTLQIGNGGTTGSITGDVTDNALLVFNRSDDLTFKGTISGSGSLEQAGKGTLILTGANTYTGGTTISRGVLQLGNGGTIGSIVGDVTNNGSLVFNRSDDVTFKGIVSGDGSLEQAGTGTLSLAATNTYTGGTTISRGVLQLGNGGTTGSIVGGVTNHGLLVFNRSNDVIFDGIVSGSGALEQAGKGTLTLTGANTYTGGTTINRGVLQLGNGGTTGSIVGDVTNNGLLIFNRSDDVTSKGIVSGSGALKQAGNGTLILTGANTYTGGTTISHGALQLGSGGTTGSIVGGVTNNGLLVFNRSNDVIFNGIVSGSGALEQAGKGTLTLTGANTYTGGTTISRGVLQLGNGGTTGSIVGGVTNHGLLVFNRSNDVIFDGIVSGSGALEQAGKGTLTLTGANTYTGGTTINRGVLQLGNGGTTGSIVGDVTNNELLAFNHNDDMTFDGTISGRGSLLKTGAGTLTLTSTNTFTGTVQINGGTVKLTSGGPLGAGIVTLDNTNKQGSTLKIESGASLSSSAVLNNESTLDNSGQISGEVEFAKIDSSEGFATVLNHDGGNISGGSIGIRFHDGATISNQSGGLISGSNMGIVISGGDSVTITNDDAKIYSSRGTGLYLAGRDINVDNIHGGVIDVAGTGILLFGKGTVRNEDGSLITSSGLSGYGIRLASGGTVVNNSSTIRGSYGISAFSGEVANTNHGSIEGDVAGISVTTTGTVINSNESSIAGGNAGVSLEGGAVYNENNSLITATGGRGFGVAISGSENIVSNTGGSIISGSMIGIALTNGGTVTNGAGSTIATTGTPNDEKCGEFGSCGILVFGPTDFEDSVSGGALNLFNAGGIIGNVEMDTTAANTITLIAGGSIDGNLTVGANTQSTMTLSGENELPQSYSDAVTGKTIFAGTLFKEGSGTWIMDSDDLPTASLTRINNGSLRATYALSGRVDIAVPGTLDAAPGVAGDLSNAGTIAIHGGNSTVGGNYTQASTGTVAVSLGSKLAVIGAATLNGGTLEVTGTDNGYVSNTHTDVLTASGGVDGTFDRLVKATGVVFTSTIINYDANSVWLDTTGLDVTTAAAGNGVSYTAASMGSAQRVQGAFEQLNSKIAAGKTAGVSSDFVRAAGQFQQAPTLQAAQASLQSLSGQLHAASAAMTFKAIDASSRALSDRFDTLLDKGNGFGMWMQNLNVGGGMARAGFDGIDFQLNGWLVGSDRRIGHSGVAGYAFGQSRGQQRLDQGLDRDNSRSTEGMMYAGWLNGNWYTQGRVGFGRFQQDVSRQLLLGNSMQGVRTRYDGNYNVAYGESGLHFGGSTSHVTPFVNVQYARIDRDGFAEQGAGGFGLRSNAQTVDRWQAGMGVRAGRRWNLDHGRSVDFSARAQWQRTLASHGDVFDASFTGMQQWQPLAGIGLSRYSGLIGVGLDATLSARTTLKFGYDYEVGQRDQAQMMSARLNVAF